MLKRIATAAVLGIVILYAGDYGVMRLRHDPTGSVMVRRYYAIQEKANRVEYMFDKEENQTCVRSLFPHMGYVTCWYLSRNTEQRENR